MGQRVGKFEIVEELGRGGMGVVYKAVDPGIGRTVALKVLPPSGTQSEELRERFLREARAAGRLQHPNIVVIHDLGEDQGNLYIAMEYLEGETLAQRIAREPGGTDVASALDVMAQVARGLEYAHQRGVVHRDIKPANILVTREGIAKILDFGIARAGDKRMTKTGQVMGTIYYMSPEQINGQQLDGRSDVFSAGIVLYELLTGDVPFDAESTGATMMKILTAPVPPLGERAPMSPRVLDEILVRSLAKKADERYASAAQFAAALEAAKAQCTPTRAVDAPTRPAKAMAVSANAEVATVLHQEKPAAGQIELEEFKGWKEEAQPGFQAEIHAAAPAPPAPVAMPSGPQTIVGETGWKWWHLLWPAGTSPTAAKVGCRFSAVVAFLVALASALLYAGFVLDPHEDPATALFMGCLAVSFAFCGAFLLRYSRVAAVLPVLAVLSLVGFLLVKEGVGAASAGALVAWSVYILLFVPGMRGAFRYHGLLGKAGTAAQARPMRRWALTGAGYAALLAVIGGVYLVKHRAISDAPVVPSEAAREAQIVTVAGNGVQGLAGDMGPATKASLNTPGGIAVRYGMLYIADCYNQRVRRVELEAGTILTIAGSGASGVDGGSFSGDGGLALEARLNRPCGVALDSKGDIYIADGGNNRIRRLSRLTGTIETVAGSGPAGFGFGGYGGDGGRAASARLSYPVALLVDKDDNLYFSDALNNRVRRVDAKTGIITTVAGNGKQGYSGDGGKAWDAALYTPQGLATDSQANLYIADSMNHCVRRVAPDGTITTVAGTGAIGSDGDGGPATSAQLNEPLALAIDAADNLYIADSKADRVRRVEVATGVITTAVGTGAQGFSGDQGSATSAELDGPADLWFDNGNLYLADARNHRIRRVSGLK